ncbi:MAG: hypothetical protein KIT17_03810 [Rubrivivax sp.]|nr:hypothetical protein [Rubrivivax sp.]
MSTWARPHSIVTAQSTWLRDVGEATARQQATRLAEKIAARVAEAAKDGRSISVLEAASQVEQPGSSWRRDELGQAHALAARIGQCIAEAAAHGSALTPIQARARLAAADAADALARARQRAEGSYSFPPLQREVERLTAAIDGLDQAHLLADQIASRIAAAKAEGCELSPVEALLELRAAPAKAERA